MDIAKSVTDIWSRLPDIWKNSGLVTIDEVRSIIKSTVVDESSIEVTEQITLEYDGGYDGLLRYIKNFKQPGANYVLCENGCWLEYSRKETVEETEKRVMKMYENEVHRYVYKKLKF